MVDSFTISSKLRSQMELAKVFEDHHLETVEKVCSDYNDELGRQVIRLKISRIDESNRGNLGDHLQSDEYMGKIGSILVKDTENEAQIEIFMPTENKPELYLSFYSKENPLAGSDKVMFKDFTYEYFISLITYLRCNFQRAAAPIVRILKDRRDVKKQIKLIRIFGVILSVLLIFKIGFLPSLLLLIFSIIFANFLYPILLLKYYEYLIRHDKI